MKLTLRPEPLAVCRLESGSAIPAWATAGAFWSVTRTSGELSVVCPEGSVPDGVRAERGWVALEVAGPLDFALVGILAELAGTLAAAGASLFALSTFDTDYLLIRRRDEPVAFEALRRAGHQVEAG